MWMSESEIAYSFIHASNLKQQLKILAELNTCTKQQIIDILRDNPSTSKQLEETLKSKSTKAKESTKLNTSMELLQQELHVAYKLCMELEEENRKLQHNALTLMEQILLKLLEKY